MLWNKFSCLGFSLFVTSSTMVACSASTEPPTPADQVGTSSQAVGISPVIVGGIAGAHASEEIMGSLTHESEEAEEERERVKKEMEARAYPNSPDADGDGAYDVKYGGTDCCDTDANTHPGVENFFTQPNACGNFDYDCSGTEEAEFGVASARRPHSLSCGTSGFVSETACGESNQYTTYKWKFGCYEQTSDETQGCH